MKWGIAAVVIVGVLVANVVFTHNQFTSQNPGMNDFLPRWEGARGYWLEGIDPYSEEAELNIQAMIFGRPAEAAEDRSLFAYPMYTVFYMLPLVGLDYPWASAVWIVILEVCLIGGLFLLLDTIRWRPSILMQVSLLIFIILNYFAFRGLILGQLSHLVFALTALTLWGLSREQDALAGVALALSTIKPQMGFLLVPFLLLWALRAGRIRFVLGFVVMFALLMAGAFVLLPTWFEGWLSHVALYPTYTRDGSPVWILFEFYGGLSPYPGYAVRAVMAGWLLWSWWQVLVNRRDERLLWTIAVTLLVTHTAGPRTATPHYMVFMLILLVSMQMLAQRRASLLNAMLLALLLIVPWVHFLSTLVDGNLESLSVFLPVVGVLLLALPLTARHWWELPPTLIPQNQLDKAADT
ncbi:MAG: glycosyltransferase family 87 protein [Chloroflexota bacterium]